MLPPSLMYGQLPQAEFVRRADQSITLHQLLDQFSHRMREQVQSRGISVSFLRHHPAVTFLPLAPAGRRAHLPGPA